MDKKRIAILLVGIILSVLVLGSCMIRVSKINNSKQMIKAIEKRDYDTLASLCDKNISGINCASTYSVFMNTVLDGMSAQTPLEAAIACNDTKAVQILLDAGADPNKNSQLQISTAQIYPLERGLAHGNYQIVEQLILHGADAHKSAQDGLDALIRNSVRKESVSLEEFIDICGLMESQSVTISYNNLLFATAVAADTELMSYLVQEKKADIQSTDAQGRILLHLCIISGKVGQKEKKEMVSFCLEQGIDINAVDAQSKTAYDYAVEKGYDELLVLIRPIGS